MEQRRSIYSKPEEAELNVVTKCNLALAQYGNYSLWLISKLNVNRGVHRPESVS